MSNTGKQSPLGVNVLSSLLQNEGLSISSAVSDLVGTSKTNSSYSPGSIVNDTCLRLLTYAINDAYNRGQVSSAVYGNLIAIGSNTIPALGNSKPPTYVVSDPSNTWTGQATTGYAISGDTGQGQDATWLPYDMTNNNSSVTQWGWLRLIALQSWNEFNWNGVSTTATDPDYKDYAASFQQAQTFIDYSNKTIMSMQNSKTFLQGTYSNMNDLISGDVTGVSLSTQAFGQDLINLGNAIDLSKISSFGLPSNLLQILYQNGAITQDVSLALLAAELDQTEINELSTGSIGTKDQEQKIFGAFLIIRGTSLRQVLGILKCKTKGITNLSQLLSVKSLFPLSFKTLTVPIYNTNPNVNSSKTYYFIFKNEGINPQLTTPAVNKKVGTRILGGTPQKAKGAAT